MMLKYGDKYTAADVNSIYDDTDGKYNYVCVTDNPTDIHDSINIIPITHEIEGHWEKVKLFRYNNLGKVLYLDLDVKIQQNIDHLFESLDKTPMICYTYWKPLDFPFHVDDRWSYNYLSNFNSSVMLWEDATHIYNKWKEDPDYYMVKYAGDDRFLFHEGFTFEHWAAGEIYSFKFDGNKYKPECSIALLNGQDQFPDLVKEYYDEFRMYKMG